MKQIIIILIFILIAFFGYKYFSKKEKKDKNPDEKKPQSDTVIYYYRKSKCTLFIDADVKKGGLIQSFNGYSGKNYASKFKSVDKKSFRRLFELHPTKEGLCLCKCETNKLIQHLENLGIKENKEIL